MGRRGLIILRQFSQKARRESNGLYFTFCQNYINLPHSLPFLIFKPEKHRRPRDFCHLSQVWREKLDGFRDFLALASSTIIRAVAAMFWGERERERELSYMS